MGFKNSHLKTLSNLASTQHRGNNNVEKFIGIKASKGKWQFQIVQSLSNDINLN